MRYINTKYISELKLIEFNHLKIVDDLLGDSVDYEKELEREQEVHSKIDYEPTTDDPKALDLFRKLTAEFKDVKWVGKALLIVPL